MSDTPIHNTSGLQDITRRCYSKRRRTPSPEYDEDGKNEFSGHNSILIQVKGTVTTLMSDTFKFIGNASQL